MIKIYYNKQVMSDYSLELDIAGTYLKASIKDMLGDVKGFDVIKNMYPYNSYGMVERQTKVKVYRRLYDSDFKFIDFNRFGMENKFDFADMATLFGTRTVLQVDTGVLSDSVSDMVIKVTAVNDASRIKVNTDEEYELIPYTLDEEALHDPLRFTLWDGYSITASGRELKANMRGEVIDGDFDTPFTGDEIEFTITKYTSDFKTKLERDIDDEEVFIDVSAGLADTRRVRLVNGKGKFRLLTFGYKGELKIKLGRKWYRVWNDYAVSVK